jgi:hypothetical protein
MKNKKITPRQLCVLKKIMNGERNWGDGNIINTLRKKNYISLMGYSLTKKAVNLLFSKNIIDKFEHKRKLECIQEMEIVSKRIKSYL